MSPSSLEVPFIPIKTVIKAMAGLAFVTTGHKGNVLATLLGNNLVKVLQTPTENKNVKILYLFPLEILFNNLHLR